jgi:predicted transcriptional regulator YdeE
MADVPEGLTLRPVAGGSYARFDCTMSELSQTWGAIYSQWLPSSAYAEDETRPSIEYYPPDMDMGPEGKAEIYIAVKPK